MPIHPTAIVHKGAEIDPTAEIGPFCVIGPQVKIGVQTRLISHVVVQNHSTLGARNTIHPFACIGGDPQDKKFAQEPASLLIGDDNVIREGVTVNIGTEQGHMQTTVGHHCLLMAYAHVAHDCHIGDHVVMANSVALAGHVDIHDHATLGGLAAVHQYCRIGRYAFISGGGMAVQDVPPFCIAQGDRATLATLNLVGLRRAGWPRERLHQVHQAFRALFFGQQSRQAAIADLRSRSDCPEVLELCDFIASSSRGVCSGRQSRDAAHDIA